MAGNQHDRQFRVDGLHFTQEGHAVHARQADVADDDAAKVLLQPALSLLGAADALGDEAFELQRLFAAEADVRVVFDDEYLQCVAHELGCSLASGMSRVNSAPPSG